MGAWLLFFSLGNPFSEKKRCFCFLLLKKLISFFPIPSNYPSIWVLNETVAGFFFFFCVVLAANSVKWADFKKNNLKILQFPPPLLTHPIHSYRFKNKMIVIIFIIIIPGQWNTAMWFVRIVRWQDGLLFEVSTQYTPGLSRPTFSPCAQTVDVCHLCCGKGELEEPPFFFLAS